MQRSLAVLLVLVLAFSGCVGSDAGPGATTSPIETEATVDASTGGIEGRVTDDELVAIAGADVAVIGGTAVKTDEAGRFALSNIEPGSVNIAVNKLGYQTKSAKATVAAGAVAELDIVLQRVLVSDPGFDEVIKWNDKLPVADACAEREAHEDAPKEWPEQTRGVTWQRYVVPVNATKPDGTDLLGIRMQIDLKHATADATLDIDMVLYDPAGKVLKHGGSEYADEYIDHRAALKPGDYLVHVCYWAGAQAEYRLTATVSYEQGERAAYLRANPKEIEYPEDP